MQDGELVMTLNTFINDDNKDYDGVVCDKGHWGRIKNCDPYFIICITDFRDPASASNCPIMKHKTKTWSNIGSVDFQSQKLKADFRMWKVRYYV